MVCPDILNDKASPRILDEACEAFPEDLRRYVKVDVDGIAEEWEQGLHVVKASGEAVWVFDTRA